MAADDRRTIAHLLRRTGLGPTAAEVDAAVAKGYRAVVDELCDFSSPDRADATAVPVAHPFTPLGQAAMSTEQRKAAAAQRGSDLQALQLWWLRRMATTDHPLREKLTLLWHGHFATSYDKVQRPDYLLRQNQVFRTMGGGDFEVLTQAVAKDPAMMQWLDTAQDRKAHPNENFARELMELFTLGIGNYTEDDVREGARAFTGWSTDRTTGTWAINARQHDSGTKTVLGQTGSWGGEDVVHILVNSPASASFIVSKVWGHFAYPVAPSDPVVADLAPAYARSRDVLALVRAVLAHPRFTSASAMSGLVKQPIEWVIGSLRALGLPVIDKRLVGVLSGLGQVPFRPPSVGGWPQNEYWLTTASSLARLTFASAVASLADLSMISALPPAQRPDAAAHLLSVAWSPTTAKGLAQAADTNELVALALVAPEFVLA